MKPGSRTAHGLPWLWLACLACGLFACSGQPKPPPHQDSATTSSTTTPSTAGTPLTVSPLEVTANQLVGIPDTPPLVFEFTIPEPLTGAGLPLWLYAPTDDDRSLIQLEVPVIGKELAEESTRSATTLNPPLLCRAHQPCAHTLDAGYWRAEQRRDDALVTELQLALSRTDQAEAGVPIRNILGVWLQPEQKLQTGDLVRFEYHGHVPARATTWTPLRARLRWRSAALSDCPGGDRSCWNELEDAEVQGLTILPEVPSFAKVIAPMDVVTGAPFEVQVVMLDRYHNPSPFTGPVTLEGSVDQVLDFNRESIVRTPVTLDTPGPHRVSVAVKGADLKVVPQWLVAHETEPAHARWVGDVHLHTGDGGAQRKFLGMFRAGDHAGLFTSIQDSLRYLDEVAGHDFGAVSEHAMRDDGFVLPAGPDIDPVFQPGGACAGAVEGFASLDGWWPLAQRASQEADGGHDGGFTVFPAFEWQSHHSLLDRTLAHRVVLFREFDPDDNLPLLPGDVPELNPRCILRFLEQAAYGPDRVLVLPHMQVAVDGNIDWTLTYTDGVNPLVPREQVEAYQRLGEIFSARSYSSTADNRRPLPGIFEGEAESPATWTHRFAWRNMAAHMGVMGASDTHMGAPGSDDDRALDGTSYTFGEAGGATVVLAPSVDRSDLWEGLTARRTYATSGPRFWMDFRVDGAPMGSSMSSTAAALGAEIAVHVGLPIQRVELFGVQVGDPTMAYETLWIEEPNGETLSTTVPIPRPEGADAEGTEWLYYVRALAGEEGVPLLELEAAWSSPVWVQWGP